MAIERFRGDTKGFTIYITDGKGNKVNIDSCLLKLSVSPIENPVNATEADYVFQKDGVITGDTKDGAFAISFIDADVDTIGDYFFDVQFTDAAGKIATLDKSTWTIKQDITK